MGWIDANLGSKVTMKYPSVYLTGEGAHGEVLSVAFAADGQHQDAGAKMVHAAPNTTSLITSKSISKGTGRTSYRGLVKIYPGMKKSKSTVRCDALIREWDGQAESSLPEIQSFVWVVAWCEAASDSRDLEGCAGFR